MTSGEKMSRGMSLFAEGFGEACALIAEALANALTSITSKLNPVVEFANKPMTKKKFRGMLQSAGIQRNEINKIVANNKDPYTYRRLSETLNLYKKEEK